MPVSVGFSYKYVVLSSMQMLAEGQETVVILEDDIQFNTVFNLGLYNVLKEAKRFVPTWDYM